MLVLTLLMMMLMLLLLMMMMVMMTTTTTMMMLMIARRAVQSASLICSPLWEGEPCRHRASRWQSLATSARLHSAAEDRRGSLNARLKFFSRQC